MHNPFFLSLLMSVAVLPSPCLLAQSYAETNQEAYLPETEEIVPLTERPIPREADTQTRLWLQLQTSGAMAGSRYDLYGQAATLNYQRYLNSFSHPIPEQFKTGGSSKSSGTTAGSSRP